MQLVPTSPSRQQVPKGRNSSLPATSRMIPSVSAKHTILFSTISDNSRIIGWAINNNSLLLFIRDSNSAESTLIFLLSKGSIFRLLCHDASILGRIISS